MTSEEFKNSLNKFLEKETYIVAYRSNYDSARQFNNELIEYIKRLQQENEELKRSYARRENKWEKFKTQKDILSSSMSNYLCKYQNLKREYKIQNGHLHKYKQENQSLKEENEDFKKDKESLNKCGFANAIQLLLAYAGLQEENQSLKDRIEKAYEITKKLSRVSDKEHLLSCALDLSLLLKGDKEC